MESMGQTLRMKFGPLPVWAWALILLGIYYWYSKRKAAQTAAANAQNNTQGVGQSSSNLGTTSVLTTDSWPMPIQLHDRKNHTQGSTSTGSTSTNNVQDGNVPASQLSPDTSTQTQAAPGTTGVQSEQVS